MDEYWPLMETKLRRLIADLVGPTIRRTQEQADLIEINNKAIDSLKRRMEGSEILADRTNNRLGIIDEFSRKIIQFQADLSLADVNFEHERAKLKDAIDVITNRVSACEENIAVLQSQTENLKNNANDFAQETYTNNSNFNEKILILQSEIDKNFVFCLEKNKTIDAEILNIHKNSGNLSKSLGDTDVIAKKTLRITDKAVKDLESLTISVSNIKKDTKDQVDKIRMLTIQYNHQSTDQNRKIKEEIKKIPALVHFQITKFLYGSFDDLGLRKKIAEVESLELEN